jgi:8-amino-7-oxononanoate synthase
MNDYRHTLDRLVAEDNLRTLRTLDASTGGGRTVEYDGKTYINLSSNDYLGLGGDVELQDEMLRNVLSDRRFVMSNPSSRLVTGNSGEYDALEAALARLYASKSALVLGSGYLANNGILTALTGRDDLVLADRLVHASLIDGLRLCDCPWGRFAHNDMDHLEGLLRKRRGRRTWVVTESIFSMDGDRAPLGDLVELKRKYDLRLYVDEAHAFGVCGRDGAGCAAEMGLDGAVDVIVGTFGKALASYGAFAAVAPTVREMLVNRMRTLIFSTALPPLTLRWSRMMVERLPELEPRRKYLRRMVQMLEGQTHIIPLMAGGNARALAMAERLREAGFWATAIRHPTVPQGQARIRISLSAALQITDIEHFIEVWKGIG